MLPLKNKKTVKMFPLSIDVDENTGKLIKCRSNHTNIVTTAKEKMCRMLGGDFDYVGETCDLANLVLDGQKKICGDMGGTFSEIPPDCDMDSFVWETVKEICTSVQGSFDDSTKKCMLSYVSPSPPSEEEDGLVFNEPYPVCKMGFGMVGESKGEE